MNEAALRAMYIDLIKRCIIGMIYEDVPNSAFPIEAAHAAVPLRYVRKLREMGRDFPSKAHSAIGLRRMENIQHCVERALEDGVPGDLMETGVWRGGACIFMRALLKAYAVTDRRVWVVDSFEGLPKADIEHFPHDAALNDFAGVLAVSLEEVQHNFAKYGLLDEQVQFLKGWFRDTLPSAPVQQLAVLRMDGDLYESTMLALTHLYPKLSPGGFAIIDDWNIPAAQQAVHDYRAQHGMTEEIQSIDGWGVYWRRDFSR